MTKPIKDFRFECAEGCGNGRWNRWTSYRKALTQMRKHGPLRWQRQHKQGHGGIVHRRNIK